MWLLERVTTDQLHGRVPVVAGLSWIDAGDQALLGLLDLY